MSTAAQRKAWNEAMREAGAKIPSSGSTGRASDRRRKASRRDKARKSSVYGDTGGSTLEEREYRVAIHMDMLEGVTDNAAAGVADDDDAYDEFEDLDDEKDTKSKNKKGAKKKRQRKGVAKSTSSASAKYLRARSLGSILIEDASRSDSTAKQYVAAAVRQYDKNDSGTITQYPPRKYCPVTGLFGVYTEPKSGIPYANLKALEQIRERAPPWMNTNNSGNATYLEAVKTLRNDA